MSVCHIQVLLLLLTDQEEDLEHQKPVGTIGEEGWTAGVGHVRRAEEGHRGLQGGSPRGAHDKSAEAAGALCDY